MSSVLRVFLFAGGLFFTISVIAMLARRKINEKLILVWLTAASVILAVSAVPDAIDRLAAKVGIGYPPSLFFSCCILILLFLVIYQSIQISLLKDKMKELTQSIAVSHYRDKSVPEPPAER